jgi:hypothetical protein
MLICDEQGGECQGIMRAGQKRCARHFGCWAGECVLWFYASGR